MRKSLAVAMVLFVAAALSLGYMQDFVDRGKDAVDIDEIVLYGDKSAAEGVQLDVITHYDYHLFWDTQYLVAPEPVINTDFRFSQAKANPPRPVSPFSIYFSNSFADGYTTGISSGSSFDLSSELAPFADVASRTKSGEERQEIVYVKDYYNFYPITVDFGRPIGFSFNEGTQKLFAEFFKIPVYPHDRVAITVGKNEAGEVRSLGMMPVKDGAVFFNVQSVATDSHCFFTVSPETTQGELLDTSLIPGGYGIYRFPLYDEESGYPDLSAHDLQTVFPINAQRARAVTLRLNAEKDKLLLVTLEEGVYVLTVIDVLTMGELQRLEIMPAKADAECDEAMFWDMNVYHEFVLPRANDGRFVLFEMAEKGELSKRFAGDCGQIDELRTAFLGDVGMDFDGNHLVMAAFQERWAWGNHCGFYLAVFGDSGLIYAGRYEHSHDKDVFDGRPLRPLDEVFLKVRWVESV